MKYLVLALATCATSALAQGKPAPDYFLDAIVATSTAESLALACPDVSVEPGAMVRSSEIVLTQLQADGFDLALPDLGMADASDAILERQQAFMAKYTLVDGSDQDAVCAVARAEIAEKTSIGRLLVDITPKTDGN